MPRDASKNKNIDASLLMPMLVLGGDALKVAKYSTFMKNIVGSPHQKKTCNVFRLLTIQLKLMK